MTTLLNTRTPRARKVHRCDLCNAKIQPGEVYVRSTYVDAGDLWDWVECGACTDDDVARLVHAQMDLNNDEGVDFDLACEWATDCVRDGCHRSDPDVVAVAIRWLKRAGVAL